MQCRSPLVTEASGIETARGLRSRDRVRTLLP
jgi:hypothetical protein